VSSDQASTAKGTIRDFHLAYYESEVWRQTFWLGVRVQKCPLDLWIYQEVLFELRPDVIVETGTCAGGSAYYLASLCDAIGSGRIITIDIKPPRRPPQHDRITYLTGSSVDREIAAAVRKSIGPDDSVMVILDSAHSDRHVLEEMRTYGPLVTQGSYLIVEDTNLGDNPVPFVDPGPMGAVQKFLAHDDAFEVDRSREKFLLTFNPSGFLRRVRPDAPER
jgi:cephalosporin hydroxylase